eukprot:1625299-Prymnesium_polylepis.1
MDDGRLAAAPRRGPLRRLPLGGEDPCALCCWETGAAVCGVCRVGRKGRSTPGMGAPCVMFEVRAWAPPIEAGGACRCRGSVQRSGRV